MGIPIAELQERISSREFAEYWVHFTLEPWGNEREDLRSGIVASTVANANRDPKKRPKPYTPDQFMPKLAGPEPDDDELTDEEAAAAHAARVDAILGEFGDAPETEPIVRRRVE